MPAQVMPPNGNEITPSRRFLPPSSASRSQPLSTIKFSRPSAGTSSPFSRTPRFRTSRDVIDDEDDEGADVEVSPKRHAAPQSGQRGLRFTAPSSTTAQLSHQFSEPSASKRRRIDKRHGGDDIDDISSAPSSPSSPEPEDWMPRVEREKAADAARHSQINQSPDHDTTVYSSSPPVPQQTTLVHTPRKARIRFQIPSEPQSKVDAFNFSTGPVPSFESRLLDLPQDSNGNPHPPISFILPNVFTPSHRRGRQDLYLKDESADSVRSLVLEMAARSEPEKQLLADVHMTVTEVLLRDPDDRFVLVKARHEYPERGKEDVTPTWLLINTGDEVVVGDDEDSSKLGTIQQGSIAIIRVGHATWAVDTFSPRQIHSLISFVPYQVGVLWTAIVNPNHVND